MTLVLDDEELEIDAIAHALPLQQPQGGETERSRRQRSEHVSADMGRGPAVLLTRQQADRFGGECRKRRQARRGNR